MYVKNREMIEFPKKTVDYSPKEYEEEEEEDNTLLDSSDKPRAIELANRICTIKTIAEKNRIFYLSQLGEC